jgi:hypothetical protein
VLVGRRAGEEKIDRGTQLDADPVALTPGITAAEGTQKHWAPFVKRSQLENAPKPRAC